MGDENVNSKDELAALFGTEIAEEARRMVAAGRHLNLKSDAAFKLFFSNKTAEA